MIGVSHLERLEARGRTPAEQRNVATVREVMEGFARSDFGVLDQHLAPDGTTWVVGFGPDTLGEHYEDPEFIPKLFCNGMHFDIKGAAAEGNLVCVEWEDEAVTNRGLTYRNTGVSLFRFDDAGRVQSYREYINPANFFEVM